MKKRFFRVLSTMMALAMLAGVMTGCGGKEENSGSGNEITISVLIASDFEDQMRPIIEAFDEAHDDIKVDIQISAKLASDMPAEMSKLAAGGNLPDVAMGVENFAYILSQGLVYPLDNLYVFFLSINLLNRMNKIV